MFSHLFRMLRMVHPELTWNELLYQANNTWERNTPSHHNLTKSDLANLLVDPHWTKATFFRAPAPRFLSAYQSKCVVREDRGVHCDAAFGKGAGGGEEGGATTTTTKNNTSESKTTTTTVEVTFDDALHELSHHTSRVFSDPHFAPQSWFCGGLNHTLQYYDFIHQLRPQTAPDYVRHLLENINVPTNIVNYLIDTVVRTGGTEIQLDQAFVRQQPHYQELKQRQQQRQQQQPPILDVTLKSHATQTKAHNTGSNKGNVLQERFHNDNHQLQLIHNGYQSDYDLFQIPQLTLEELTLAGV
jgi:hypothetical protein